MIRFLIILSKVLAVLALLMGVALLFLQPDERRRIMPFLGGINKSAYQPFADVIGKSEKILLFEGLPRLLPTPDPEQQILSNDTFTSHGEYFRPAEIIPSPEDAAALKLLAMSSATFSKRGGFRNAEDFIQTGSSAGPARMAQPANYRCVLAATKPKFTEQAGSFIATFILKRMVCFAKSSQNTPASILIFLTFELKSHPIAREARLTTHRLFCF